MARKYSKTFKREICELVIKEEIKTKVIAERFGISQIMIYRWLDEYKTYGEEAFVGRGYQRKEEIKIKKLEKENEELRMENEILKKAAAYFSRTKEKE